MNQSIKNFSSYDDFRRHIFTRANSLKSKLINPIPGVTNRKVRSEKGLVHTFNLLAKSAENAFYTLPTRGGIDSVDAMFHTFSNTPGMEAVRNVNTITALDVTIASITKSFIPFLAIERGMDSDSVNIYYRNIVAINNAAGFAEGETVIGNFTSPLNKLNLGNQVVDSGWIAGANGAEQVDFAVPIIAGTVKVISVDTATKLVVNYTAEDLKKNGTFQGTPGAGTIESQPVITVNYKTGQVNIANVKVGASYKVQSIVDTTGEKDGANTLKITTKMSNSLLLSENIRLINQESIEDINFINKIQAQIKIGGAQLDYAALGLKDLTSLYIQYINSKLINAVIGANGTTKHADVDISSYAVSSSSSDTKDNFVNKFMIDLNQSMLSASGLGTTCYLVGPRAANLLMNVRDRFKALPSAYDDLNSVIGSYDNIPVLRHNMVDAWDQANLGADKCSVYGIYKDPNNDCGALAYGEFLPMYMSSTSVNYDNPSQFSRSLFAQNGVSVISNEVMKRGEIKYA